MRVRGKVPSPPEGEDGFAKPKANTVRGRRDCHSAWNGAKRSGSAESLNAVFNFVVVVVVLPSPLEGEG
jgi:hypothetical protein